MKKNENFSFTCQSDIAIIGMSCRFPGNVSSPEEFWQFLLRGGDGIVAVPDDRWENKAYFDLDKNKKNKMYVNSGGFIEKLDKFDPLFFGISPKEAPLIDPQHRWLLELTYEAFENAGLKTSQLKGSNTAVYIGQFMHDYEQLLLDSAAHEHMTSHSATGPSMTLTSNRISYLFDFTGPSVTLDTACSSSLVALDFACKALQNGDSDLAIAGGVNILLRPELTMSICKASMLSPDCRCKSFDESANGYVRSEGAGIVLVKRLSDALRDRDNVLAVIKATGVNQDGQTIGITVPNGSAQQKLLISSLSKARIKPEEIQYAEAHGTGTAVGDPIEVNALGAVLGVNRLDNEECIVGSVKSNIGHTEAAAGMAGLIKTVLAMRYGVIPKNIHYSVPNPAIDLKNLNIKIADKNIAWPDSNSGMRYAVVNSFGFGGTNANVVLMSPASVGQSSAASHIGVQNNSSRMLLLSSKTELGLRDQAIKFRQFIHPKNDSAVPDGSQLGDICFSAATKRDHHKYRLAVCARDGSELVNELDGFISKIPTSGYQFGSEKNKLGEKICFVFSGMGTQWFQMGRSLYNAEPIFQAELNRCDVALSKYTQKSLLDAVFNTAGSINDANVAQPGIFAIQVSLAALLKSWGLVPNVIVGHSAGEVAAAFVAGALSFEDPIKVVYFRSKLQHTTEGLGKMLAVGLSELSVKPYLINFNEKVSIAAINSDDAITLSGDEESLLKITESLEKDDIFAKFLNVGVPYHSPVMDQLKEPLIEALQTINVLIPHTTLFSTVSGLVTSSNNWNAEYWADNVREPVRFKDAIENIIQLGVNTFLEIGPHGALTNSVEKILEKSHVDGVCFPTLKRGQDDVRMLMQCIGGLHVNGYPINWDAIFHGDGSLVNLPNYAWQHASYWAEADVVRESRIKNITRGDVFIAPTHPLLGGRLNSSVNLWQSKIDLGEFEYLIGHQVEREVVYPGAAYIEMAIACARENSISTSITLHDIEFSKALFLRAELPSTLETVFDSQTGCYEIQAYDSQSGWTSYSQGVLGAVGISTERQYAFSELKQKFTSYFDKESFYQHCHQLGLTYVDSFQIVEQAWFSDLESLVEIVVPDNLIDSMVDYHLHPVILDGAFQSLFPTIEGGYLPIKINQLMLYKKPESHVFAYLVTHFKNSEIIQGDITLFSQDGEVLVEVFGVELRSIATQDEKSLSSIIYDFEWERKPLLGGERITDSGYWIVFVDQQGIGSRLISELQYRSQSVCVIEKGVRSEKVSAHHYKISTDSFSDISEILNIYKSSSIGLIYLWGVDHKIQDNMSGDEIFNDCLSQTFIPVQLIQAVNSVDWLHSQRLFFVTQNAQFVEAVPALTESSQAALWGFGRVLASEYPEYSVSLIDLDWVIDDDQIDFLAHQLTHDEYEQEVAFRSGIRFVNRLRQLGYDSLETYSQSTQNRHGLQSYEVQKISKKNLGLIQSNSLSHSVGDVVINVEVSYLSHDFFNQMLPQNEMGGAHLSNPSSYLVVGKITKIAATVENFAVGDRVIGLVHDAKFHASECIVTSDQLILSAGIENSSCAATLGVRFLIAYYGLHHLIQLNAESTILIHNAAEGDGLAAVQLAKLTGAKIYATADTIQKHKQLRELGVVNVYDINSHRLNTELLEEINGSGFDAIFNVAAEGAVYKTASLLKPFGIWIDVGAALNKDEPLMLSQITSNNVLYHSVNLDDLIRHRSKLSISILDKLLKLVVGLDITNDLLESCELPSIPVSHLPSVEHNLSIEKSGILLKFDDVSLINVGCLIEPINSRSTYLITGGLGGLGLEMMNWLAEQGASSIVLLGRSAPSSDALSRIKQCESVGVRIEVIKADITNSDDVKNVFSKIQEGMLPLAGIIHSAGLLDDGVISHQTIEKFSNVFAAKVKGAWNLHQFSKSINLDFFICFSSIASIVGWAGQSNYAAANAFMDSLAFRRRSEGRAALTVNWGPWSGSGMAANLGERDIQRMNNAGMNTLIADQAFSAMLRLMKFRVPQAGIFELDWRKMVKLYPNPDRKTLFKNFVNESDVKESVPFIEQLLSSPKVEYEILIKNKIAEILADVLGIHSIDTIEFDRNVFEYGMNSLMSMDFKNRLQSELRLKLPTTLVLKYPTVDGMTEQLSGMFEDQEEITY